MKHAHSRTVPLLLALAVSAIAGCKTEVTTEVEKASPAPTAEKPKAATPSTVAAGGAAAQPAATTGSGGADSQPAAEDPEKRRRDTARAQLALKSAASSPPLPSLTADAAKDMLDYLEILKPDYEKVKTAQLGTAVMLYAFSVRDSLKERPALFEFASSVAREHKFLEDRDFTAKFPNLKPFVTSLISAAPAH
jgi:hypothetical protein